MPLEQHNFCLALIKIWKISSISQLRKGWTGHAPMCFTIKINLTVITVKANIMCLENSAKWVQRERWRSKNGALWYFFQTENKCFL